MAPCGTLVSNQSRSDAAPSIQLTVVRVEGIVQDVDKFTQASSSQPSHVDGPGPARLIHLSCLCSLVYRLS